LRGALTVKGEKLVVVHSNNYQPGAKKKQSVYCPPLQTFGDNGATARKNPRAALITALRNEIQKVSGPALGEKTKPEIKNAKKDTSIFIFYISPRLADGHTS